MIRPTPDPLPGGEQAFVLVVVLVLVIDWLACLRGGGRARGRVGSWSQCAPKKSCRLSMNRPTPDPSRRGASARPRRVSSSWERFAGEDLRQRRNFSLSNGPDLLIVRSVGREEKCGGPREALWKTGLKTN